jgi:hypothetical protein
MEGILFLIPAQKRYNLDSWLVKTIVAEIDLRTLLFSWCLCPGVYGSCCREGMPKRFSNDDTMVWILIRCKTQTWKFMCGRLPGKRIVCSACKVTTCSSVYQTCQVVVNSMLHQQGDNMVIVYQSWHATAWNTRLQSNVKQRSNRLPSPTLLPPWWYNSSMFVAPFYPASRVKIWGWGWWCRKKSSHHRDRGEGVDDWDTCASWDDNHDGWSCNW